MAKFSLAWDSHKNNICEGLTALQQNGEFVDMTLAADGHHVKVHQMVISLASPYLKDIITSIQSPHPVIFLNKISYPVLSAILEYIYTGEVLIDKDCINELIEAAQELHIKGLENMKVELPNEDIVNKSVISKSTQGQPLSEYQYNQKEEQTFDESEAEQSYETAFEHTYLESMDTENEDTEAKTNNTVTESLETIEQGVKGSQPIIQYTISNMGALQMILNRYLYSLRYTSVKGAEGHRKWRCVEYSKKKCPAGVVSKGGVVTKRFGAHNHPFHDKRILKKVRDGSVYSAVRDAEALCKIKPVREESHDV